MINCQKSIYYTDYCRTEALNNTGIYAENGEMWQELYSSLWQSEAWKNAFPEMTRFSDDFSDTDNPDFVPNPAYSTVTGNVSVNIYNNIGTIADSVYRFSTVKDNAVFGIEKLDDIFVSAENGDYTLKEDSILYDILPDFEATELSEIGRK